MKELVGPCNKEKAPVGAFSRHCVISRSPVDTSTDTDTEHGPGNPSPESQVTLSPLSCELQFWPWKHFTWLEIISNSVNYTFRWVQIVYGLGCRLFLLSAYIQSCSYLQSLPSLSRGFIKNIKSDILFHPFQQKQINLWLTIFSDPISMIVADNG